jgi:hypothetical protein
LSRNDHETDWTSRAAGSGLKNALLAGKAPGISCYVDPPGVPLAVALNDNFQKLELAI